MHYHTNTVSITGANLSRPVATRELAEFVELEIDAALQAAGQYDNARVDLVECDKYACYRSCSFCGQVDALGHPCDGRLVVGRPEEVPA